MISIIVPIYKVEPYIHRCIDSILSQTYTDFELILVDDGSPDKCGSICDDYSKKDSRIHVIHQENGGLSAARNSGLDVAVGNYVCFVDSDDWVADNLLETVVPYLCKYDMVRFRYFSVIDESTEVATWPTTGVFNLSDDASRAAFIAQKLLRVVFPWCAWAGIYDRNIIEKYHLRYADNRKIFAEDMYFTLCYCSHVNNIISLETPLYYYVQRTDSIMGIQQHILNAGRMNELSKAVLQHFTDNNMAKAFFDAFPLMHYYILDNVIHQHIYITKMSLSEMRKALLRDISDFDYFSKKMKGLKRCKTLMRPIYPKASDYYIAVNTAQYYATGSIIALLKINLLEKWKAFKVKIWPLLKLLKIR